MAHFAEISHADPTTDNPATVLRVVVVNDKDIRDEDNQESEAIGITYLQSSIGGEWAQTSYNHKFRVRYAGIGALYNGIAFYAPSPHPSWTLDADYNWQPPVAAPADMALGRDYEWDEDGQAWVENQQPPLWVWDAGYIFTDPGTGEEIPQPQYVPPKPYPDDEFSYLWDEETGDWHKAT